MMTNALPDFSGKCLSITIADDDVSHDLYDPHFEYQGNRLFLIGTVTEESTDSKWNANCQGGIAWDRVTDYFVFKDLEAYREAVKISADHEASKSIDILPALKDEDS